MNDQEFDALILISFGGPEGPDDVMPYMENVLRGKNVPRERMEEVCEHYYGFGGISPINQQNRDLIKAIKTEFEQHNIDLPVYWGNRNWHPFIVDTMREMKNDGIRKALAFFTNGYSCYSGCRQYRREHRRRPGIDRRGCPGSSQNADVLQSPLLHRSFC